MVVGKLDLGNSIGIIIKNATKKSPDHILEENISKKSDGLSDNKRQQVMAALYDKYDHDLQKRIGYTGSVLKMTSLMKEQHNTNVKRVKAR